MIFISPSESSRASHIVIFELYTSQNDNDSTFTSDLREGYKIHGGIILESSLAGYRDSLVYAFSFSISVNSS